MTNASGPSARCPVCDKEHHADSLAALVQGVSRCCKTKRLKIAAQRLIMKRPAMPKLPVTLVFDRSIHSQNESTYAHWSVYSQDRKDWRMRCLPTLLPLAGLNLWWSRWSFVREYVSPAKEMDYANAVGGAKGLIDCLIDQQVIRDDRPKHFLCSYDQRRAESNRTILTLEEYHDEPGVHQDARAPAP